MSGDTRAEWTVMLLLPQSQSYQVRFGAGMGRVTYDLRPAWRTQSLTQTAVHMELDAPPYERWNHVTWHLAVGIELFSTSWLDVYVEHRIVRGRLRSQTQQLYPSSDDPPRQTPYDEWGTASSEVVLGIKSDFSGTLPFELDVLLRRGEIRPRNTSSWDLTAHALGVRSGGSVTGIQFGAFWHP